MKWKQLLIQALIGGVIYWIISLILEKDWSAEAMQREGLDALVFALLYGGFMWGWDRFKKK